MVDPLAHSPLSGWRHLWTALLMLFHQSNKIEYLYLIWRWSKCTGYICTYLYLISKVYFKNPENLLFLMYILDYQHHALNSWSFMMRHWHWNIWNQLSIFKQEFFPYGRNSKKGSKSVIILPQIAFLSEFHIFFTVYNIAWCHVSQNSCYT